MMKFRVKVFDRELISSSNFFTFDSVFPTAQAPRFPLFFWFAPIAWLMVDGRLSFP